MERGLGIQVEWEGYQSSDCFYEVLLRSRVSVRPGDTIGMRVEDSSWANESHYELIYADVQ